MGTHSRNNTAINVDGYVSESSVVLNHTLADNMDEFCNVGNGQKAHNLTDQSDPFPKWGADLLYHPGEILNNKDFKKWMKSWTHRIKQALRGHEELSRAIRGKVNSVRWGLCKATPRRLQVSASPDIKAIEHWEQAILNTTAAHC